MHYNAINGWTKKKIIEVIRTRPDGQCLKRGDDSSCAYRGANGARCAVGVFIPNHLYRRTMEDLGAPKLLESFPHLEKLMPLDSDALKEFQQVHDYGCEGDTKINAKLIAWVRKNVK